MILPTKKKIKGPIKNQGFEPYLRSPSSNANSETDRYLAIQRGEFSPLQI